MANSTAWGAQEHAQQPLDRVQVAVAVVAGPVHPGAHLDGNPNTTQNDCIDSNDLSRRCTMATITIRNLDDPTKARLRMRAASHDRSMEEEARVILREALQDADGERGLGTLIHKRFVSAGGAELPPPDRKHRPRKPDNLE
jgi:plasmid stability protein